MNYSSIINPPQPAYAPAPVQNYAPPPGYHDQIEGFAGVPGAPSSTAPPAYEPPSMVEGYSVSGSHASAPAPPSYEQSARKISYFF